MTNPNSPKASANGSPIPTAEEVAALALRITAIEQTLAAKIPGFEQVGGRVAELSTAFQQANTRLGQIEAAVTALAEAPPPVGAEALAALATRLDNVTARVAAVESARARGGRLSARLAGIEAKLDQVIGTPGGTS